MRRMMVLCLLSMIAMSLGECQFHFATSTAAWTTDESGSRYVEGVLVTGDSTLAVIDVLDYGEGRYPFDYTIDEIHVDVLLSTITVDYTIVDEQYPYYYFYSQMRQADGWGECVNYTHRDPEMSSFSRTIVFPYVDGTETYRFLLVKAFKGPKRYVEDEDIDKATAGFTISIPSYDYRKHMLKALIGIDNVDNDFYNEPGKTRASGFISFYDPDSAVTSATLSLYEDGTDRLVYTDEIDTTDARNEDGLFIARGLSFLNLSPGVLYRFELVVTGNDGIDPIVERLLGSRTYETERFYSTFDTAHGMYAYLIDVNLTKDIFTFRIRFLYDGWTGAAGGDPIAFLLRIRDEDGNLLHEEPFDQQGFSTRAFDNEFLGIGHTVSIESADGTILLARNVVSYLAPTVNVYYESSTVSQQARLSWNFRTSELVEGWVEILQGDTVIWHCDLTATHTEVIQVLSGIDYYGSRVMVHYHYEYTAFDGHDRVVVDETVPAM